MIRLALHVGRLDWWNIEAELSPRDIRVLQAYTELEPWGDQRADLRAAVNTAATVASNSVEEIPEDAISRLCKTLVEYLEKHEDNSMSPNAMAAMMRQRHRGNK